MVRIVDRRQPQRLGVLREGERGDTLGRHALHLLGGQRRIPHGYQHEGDVATRSGATPLLDQPVVVMLQTLETELTVAGIHEQLTAEAGNGGEAQGGEHAGAVHVFEAGPRVVAPGSHVRIVEWLGAESSFVFPTTALRPTVGNRLPS